MNFCQAFAVWISRKNVTVAGHRASAGVPGGGRHHLGLTMHSYMLDWFFDDQPTWFRTDKGQILAVPYPSMELNELPAYVNRGASDSDFTRMMMDAFDEQLEEASSYPTVYCVSLHTFLTGQPQRIRQLRTVLQHIATHRDEIWFTTPGAIAEHVAQLPVGTVPGDTRS